MLPSPVVFNPIVEKKYSVYKFHARNCTLLEVARFVYMKNHQNVEIRFTHRPTVLFITKFRANINPNFWFVYPKEVT